MEIAINFFPPFSFNKLISGWVSLPVEALDRPENVDRPFPASLPNPPNTVGRNMATKPDVINWAPIKTGNMSFFRKNANTPIPKPAKKELLADESEIKVHLGKA